MTADARLRSDTPLAPTQQTDEALVDAVERATRAIEAETTELRRNCAMDFARHRHAKDLCLLDLTRRSRALQSIEPGADARRALARLRDAIIDNQSALRIRLSASRQVANILIDVMVTAESDRTYERVRPRAVK